MKIAIVGSGVSGLVAARKLCTDHEVTVFEAAERIGGHTNTVEVSTPAGPLAVDTGFIVFNEKTYPNFCALMHEIGVEYKPSTMSFSVRCSETGLEYNGTSLNGLFAQRRNLVRPEFWRMTREIVRFYEEAPKVLEGPDPEQTLGEFLDRGQYSTMFVDKHLVPMCAAVWSARAEVIRAFPLRFLVQFFHNHGFLQLKDRPEWQVIRGGSREYLGPLTEPFADRIRVRTPIASVRRRGTMVLLETAQGQQEVFDRVVLACHSDQALRMLQDATPKERELLGALPYQRNEATLHTDESLMPQRKRAWASWNYHVEDDNPGGLPQVTYWMNELQGFEADKNYFVTLNRSKEIEPSKVIREILYHHPIFTLEGVAAQARFEEIDGANSVHFAGAYWSYGFHEDGVKSGLRVAERIQAEVPIA